MKRRLLLVLPQMPQDPASGAARNAQTVCEMAAEGGWEVRAIGTTATERGITAEALPWLKGLGLQVQVQLPAGKRGRQLTFSQRGIPYTLLDTRTSPVLQWEPGQGRHFDYLFENELARFRPDVVLTYGGEPAHVKRLKRAQQAGTKIAFYLQNPGYLVTGFLDWVDAVLTPSDWLSKRYLDAVGLKSTPLPTPLELADVLVEEHEPIFVTMVNPSVEKGLFFYARLAEELGARYPDIAVLTVESRGTAGLLAEAGRVGGFDLRRHENLMFSPPTPRPRDFLQPTRILLVPSVWEEAAGRVVPEAMINGIPPLVSDRGALAETCNGAGFVLPLPADLTMQSSRPVDREAVEPWLSVIARLCQDDAFYAQEAARARAAAGMFRREVLAPRYVRFFENILG